DTRNRAAAYVVTGRKYRRREVLRNRERNVLSEQVGCGLLFWKIRDAVSAADDRAPVASKIVGKTQARCDVPVLGGLPCGCRRAVQPGINEAQVLTVEVSNAVLDLSVRREDVIAYAEVESEAIAELPVVLEEGGVLAIPQIVWLQQKSASS